MAAGRIVVERVEQARDREAGRVHVDQEHRRAKVGPSASSVRAITMLIAAPGAPVISHLRPLMTNSSPSAARGGFHQHRDRSPRHRQARSSRRPCESRRDQRSEASALFARSFATLSSRLVLPSSGAMNVERERAERRPSRGLEHHRHRAMVETEPAPLCAARAARAVPPRGRAATISRRKSSRGRADPGVDRVPAERSLRG